MLDSSCDRNGWQPGSQGRPLPREFPEDHAGRCRNRETPCDQAFMNPVKHADNVPLGSDVVHAQFVTMAGCRQGAGSSAGARRGTTLRQPQQTKISGLDPFQVAAWCRKCFQSCDIRSATIQMAAPHSLGHLVRRRRRRPASPARAAREPETWRTGHRLAALCLTPSFLAALQSDVC